MNVIIDRRLFCYVKPTTLQPIFEHSRLGGVMDSVLAMDPSFADSDVAEAVNI
jgi:hypothetical protein